ncbi:MAG: hypothetical protein HN501_02265 [Waddliaceae bacterium]|jgi:hypothetical protein|nr:hypothetical protein [Waddliaceae bacterium]MBT6928218.1 hypothetical protein [Waddliaceae bacterium]
MNIFRCCIPKRQASQQQQQDDADWIVSPQLSPQLSASDDMVKSIAKKTIRPTETGGAETELVTARALSVVLVQSSADDKRTSASGTPPDGLDILPDSVPDPKEEECKAPEESDSKEEAVPKKKPSILVKGAGKCQDWGDKVSRGVSFWDFYKTDMKQNGTVCSQQNVVVKKLFSDIYNTDTAEGRKKHLDELLSFSSRPDLELCEIEFIAGKIAFMMESSKPLFPGEEDILVQILFIFANMRGVLENVKIMSAFISAITFREGRQLPRKDAFDLITRAYHSSFFLAEEQKYIIRAMEELVKHLKHSKQEDVIEQKCLDHFIQMLSELRGCIYVLHHRFVEGLISVIRLSKYNKEVQNKFFDIFSRLLRREDFQLGEETINLLGDLVTAPSDQYKAYKQKLLDRLEEGSDPERRFDISIESTDEKKCFIEEVISAFRKSL